MRVVAALLGLSLGAISAAGCSSDSPSSAPTATASDAAPAAATSAALPPLEPVDPARPLVREGGALRRGVGEGSLYIADEDHKSVRRVPLPVRGDALGKAFDLPGPPAQVLPLAGRVLVTVREPGMLLILEPTADGGLSEKARVSLPADAWGIAVTSDLKTALVSSAWTNRVSVVDLEAMTQIWSIEVGREPRAIVIKDGGTTAYVTHLVGGAITRLDAQATTGLRETPKTTVVPLPPAPLRSPSGVTLPASLGYAAALSPDESRLFVARHALGALGEDAWFGASTVDVLLTADDSPLAPRRHDRLPFLRADKAPMGTELIVPGKPLSAFTQPRAIAYRKTTRTILVASEGDDLVAELDATGLDPTRAVLRTFKVGSGYDPGMPVAATCAAPAGIALSDDDKTVWVWCRGTYDLATVTLDDFGADRTPTGDKPTAITTVHVAEDPLGDAEIAIGRRLFYNATDKVMSGGLACAGCHPEGRDDGHVWHEAKFNTKDGTHLNFVGHEANIPAEEGVNGVPRRTPMLAGMVAAPGPYGWRGESADLPTRLAAGFGLHRWGGMPAHDAGNLVARSGRLMLFLRRGLLPPPATTRELDATERRGRELFSSGEVGCAACHVPETGFTNRLVAPLAKLAPRGGYDDEEKPAFKTPSLRWIGGRAPYFHDGRAPSLEWIINNNNDRMGTTNHLSGVDRAALVAYLKTL